MKKRKLIIISNDAHVNMLLRQKGFISVDRRNTVDMAVTLAKALELDLSGADGKVIEEILA